MTLIINIIFLTKYFMLLPYTLIFSTPFITIKKNKFSSNIQKVISIAPFGFNMAFAAGNIEYKENVAYTGSSTGAVAACLTSINLMSLELILNFHEHLRSISRFKYIEALGEFLTMLPDDVHLRCSNKIAVGTTKFKMHWLCPYILSILLLKNYWLTTLFVIWYGVEAKPIIITKFYSKKHLITVLQESCSVYGIQDLKIRNRIDGGFSIRHIIVKDLSNKTIDYDSKYNVDIVPSIPLSASIFSVPSKEKIQFLYNLPACYKSD